LRVHAEPPVSNFVEKDRVTTALSQSRPSASTVRNDQRGVRVCGTAIVASRGITARSLHWRTSEGIDKNGLARCDARSGVSFCFRGASMLAHTGRDKLAIIEII
jgi:hypothetical protein